MRRPLAWIAIAVVTLGLCALGALFVEYRLQLKWADEVFSAARRHPPHPLLQTVAADQVDHVNAAGFRGEPVAIEKVPGSIRIITLGGSTTLGIGLPYEDTYPYLLARLLRDRFPGATIEVQNAGAAWYSTAHVIVNYELRVRKYKPDVVVVFEAINDLYRSCLPQPYSYGPYQPDYAHFLGPTSDILGPAIEAPSREREGEWLLWRRVRNRLFGPPPAREVERTDFQSVASYKDYYARLLTILTRDGVQVLTASQPYLYRDDLTPREVAKLQLRDVMCTENGTYPSVRSMRLGMEAFNRAAREIAGHMGVPVIDFEGNIPKTLEYFTDDVHLTRKANAIMAGLTAERLAESGLIR